MKASTPSRVLTTFALARATFSRPLHHHGLADMYIQHIFDMMGSMASAPTTPDSSSSTTSACEPYVITEVSNECVDKLGDFVCYDRELVSKNGA
ncbi:hypothetical protein F4778DRAFT_775617 [Xylariomycetidae sp. FL2044]|nr:hypothetical protein F4778DRAFT_775617 [Xylariomycetidae sp. FL2044]